MGVLPPNRTWHSQIFGSLHDSIKVPLSMIVKLCGDTIMLLISQAAIVGLSENPTFTWHWSSAFREKGP